MKKIFFLLFLLPTLAAAQSKHPQPPGAPIAFTDIIRANDSALNKSELFSRCIEWIGQNYNSAKAVVDVQDREGGVIIAKAIAEPTYKGILGEDQPVTTKYIMEIRIKEGRIKIDLRNFILDNPNLPGFTVTDAPHNGYRGLGAAAIQRLWVAAQKGTTDTHTMVVTGLQSAINKPSKDW